MEASIVTVIIGVGVTAMLQLLAAGTVANSEGTELTTAINLANNVREISLGLAYRDPQTPTQWSTKESSVTAYDDVIDLNGCAFSPPLDARRLPITDYSNWSQNVVVQTVAEDQVNSTRPNSTASPTARVAVTITHNSRQVYQTSWLAVAPNED